MNSLLKTFAFLLPLSVAIAALVVATPPASQEETPEEPAGTPEFDELLSLVKAGLTSFEQSVQQTAAVC